MYHRTSDRDQPGAARPATAERAPGDLGRHDGGSGWRGIMLSGVAPGHGGSVLPAGSTVVSLDGDLSIAAVPALRVHLMGVLRPGTWLMVVDLSRVQSCDTAGLAVLIGTQRRAKARGIVMRLAAPSPPVAELLYSTGLGRCLTVCPDLPGALA